MGGGGREGGSREPPLDPLLVCCQLFSQSVPLGHFDTSGF